MVQLKRVENMFWALVLEEGKRYSQTVEQSFHISMAALELPSDAETLKGRHHQTVSVMVASQKSEFLICSLNFKHQTQQPLDLNFNEGEEVTFFVNGQGTVHLTGYQLEDDNDLDDLEGFDMDEEEEDSDNEVPELVTPGKRKKESQAMVPKKKTKWLTPGGSEFSEDDDEDSDDDDDDDEDDDEELNTSDLLDMEAAESDDEDDDDFEIDDKDDDEEDSDEEEEDESDEEMEEVLKPRLNQQKVKETPKQQQKKEKQTPKPDQSKTPKQDKVKTIKQDQNKTPKQDKKDQNQKSTATPAATPGAGGDAESSQSAKKKKKKKKKNKHVENGEQEQGGKTPQLNTPKPGQNQQTPGQKQQTPGQKQQTPGQKQQTPGQKQQTPGQKQQTPGQNQQNQQGKTPQQSKTPQPSKTPKKQVLAGGIIAEDIHIGDGQPAKKGKMAHVYYVGKLQKDGRQFDSCTSGKPFKFKLGLGEVIQGWDKGVEGMKMGGKRRLTIPPQQGYGNQRSGPIPPNSTLVFEVELKNVS